MRGVPRWLLLPVTPVQNALWGGRVLLRRVDRRCDVPSRKLLPVVGQCRSHSLRRRDLLGGQWEVHLPSVPGRKLLLHTYDHDHLHGRHLLPPRLLLPNHLPRGQLLPARRRREGHPVHRGGLLLVPQQDGRMLLVPGGLILPHSLHQIGVPGGVLLPGRRRVSSGLPRPPARGPDQPRDAPSRLAAAAAARSNPRTKRVSMAHGRPNPQASERERRRRRKARAYVRGRARE